MAKRKSLSKKIRFEVFKRDSFTCQYCGCEAPDVILHVDHIDPVSKGGGNDIMNLITSCQGCNLGKSDRELSDNTVVKKKKGQLNDLQERKNQIEMIAEWQKSLLDIRKSKCDLINDIIDQRTGMRLVRSEIPSIYKPIESFGLSEVCEAINIAINQYYDGSEVSMNKCLDKLGGICYFRQKDNPKNIKEAYYIKGVLDNRGIIYKYPVVKFTSEALDSVGYEYALRAAKECADFDEYMEFILNEQIRIDGVDDAKTFY